MSHIVEHISASQLDTWFTCEGRWYFNRVCGIKIPPSYALPLGGSCHRGLEHNYSQKIESHEDLPAEECAEVFAEDFAAKVEAEEIDWEGESEGSVKDRGVTIVKTHITERAPILQPVAVEYKMEVEIPNTTATLLSYIDLKDDKKVLRDHKTGKRKKEQKAMEDDLQGIIYSITDPDNAGFSWEPTITLKKETYCQTDLDVVKYSTQQKSTILGDLPQIVTRMQEVADTGLFTHRVDGWNVRVRQCTPENCGYWNICKG